MGILRIHLESGLVSIVCVSSWERSGWIRPFQTCPYFHFMVRKRIILSFSPANCFVVVEGVPIQARLKKRLSFLHARTLLKASSLVSRWRSLAVTSWRFMTSLFTLTVGWSDLSKLRLLTDIGELLRCSRTLCGLSCVYDANEDINIL